MNNYNDTNPRKILKEIKRMFSKFFEIHFSEYEPTPDQERKLMVKRDEWYQCLEEMERLSISVTGQEDC